MTTDYADAANAEAAAFEVFEVAVDAEADVIAAAEMANVAVANALWRRDDRPDAADHWAIEVDAIVAPHEAMIASNAVALAEQHARAAAYAVDLLISNRPPHGWT